MGISWKEVAFFGGGVAVGLLAAKLYAEAKVNSTISSTLDTLHLGFLTPTVQGLVTPAVVG